MPTPDPSQNPPPSVSQPSNADVVRFATFAIPSAELVWRFSASGGPGGQHANTSNTKASVTFDIAHSPSLPDEVRERLIARLGIELTCVASDERSQLRNRALALDRLQIRLADALRVNPTRRPTRRSKGSQERRLQTKSQHSATKSARRTRYYRSDD